MCIGSLVLIELNTQHCAWIFGSHWKIMHTKNRIQTKDHGTLSYHTRVNLDAQQLNYRTCVLLILWDLRQWHIHNMVCPVTQLIIYLLVHICRWTCKNCPVRLYICQYPYKPSPAKLMPCYWMQKLTGVVRGADVHKILAGYDIQSILLAK